MRQLTAITVLCAMGILACSTTSETLVKKSRYSRDHIYFDEIFVSKAANAYDLIRNSHPHWLQPRAGNSISYPVVFVDGTREGGLRVLSTIATQHIAEIQFFNAADAFIRFGPNCPGGAILVTSN
jgi:glutaredoxin